MNNKYPYYGYPYHMPHHVNPQVQGQVQESAYKKKNTKTHFLMGAVAGAAVAYLLTNKTFQQGVATTGEKAWSTVRGEVEELKERLEDTQAELEYYRNLHKGEE
ncbi:hypothetical protein ABT56_12970 [Photobacterium aquae]|uniref:YtxH domain-containing protein n=1 Tax=Photobacterium aquae TaxID=1195763 RepID=A0A0J1GZQ4_9GAMM|nr:hypothetical protein [Photobacterium aquae]KLV05103.1 hypothetical protein ABT56_12970 [Photobacterium aquae]